ncbi:protein kinase family protein [Geodermatophilus maliterrae]|uniref:Protein kinase domain-containing protein n=1 Tax=Geodermatophilus maliterrae TaxID=3162531 RepID=A0ABV3XI09_9ACTN
MTSTITGLPDRYRPLEEVGPVERTETGVIHSWRAKDRVLNRDVAVRVHEPGGPAARTWITRALTAGGLATPALAMVYDASEGNGDGSGSAAYVVNEWIEGQTLAERLESGAMDEREARTVLRRLAEGVAEAHRVGLAVGGLSPETVVLRPNGLVGLRAVPAATGTVHEDIAALGALLEYCLTGSRAGVPGSGGTPSGPPPIAQPDLAALVRRARSTEPGTRLASAAAIAALLAERPRSGATPVRGRDESDSGWLRRLREHRDTRQEQTQRVTGAPAAPPADDRDHDEHDDVARRLEPDTLPPVPRGRTAATPAEEPVDEPVIDDGGFSPARRKLLVVGLPLVALLIVIALAYWVGTNVLSVAGDVDEVPGSAPPAPSTSPAAEESAAPSSGGAPAVIAEGAVFDPFGDGDPDNPRDVPASYDGDPATAWSTVTYRGSAEFGGLKPGIGVVYDLGSAQPVAGVSLTTTTPGISVEVRTGDAPDGDLETFPVATAGTVDGTAELAFAEPVTTQYVLVWMTGLVPADDGFAGALAEVAVTPAT